jgi:hypothetical protein
MLSRLRSFARMIFRRSRWEEDTRDEIQFHIEERAEFLRRSGVPDDDALRSARMEFGAVENYRERCREAVGVTEGESGCLSSEADAVQAKPRSGLDSSKTDWLRVIEGLLNR